MRIREDLFELCIEKIGDAAIFEMIIGEFKPRKLMKSPLRDERHASFNIFVGKNNRLYYKDFGSNESGDCFDLAAKYYNVSTIQAVRIIMSHFGLSDETIVDKRNAIVKFIRETNEEFNNAKIDCFPFAEQEEDYSYFDQFGISEATLKLFKVKSIKEVYINNAKKHVGLPNFPIFSYSVGNKVRIYRPLSDKAVKWRGNLTSDCVFGYEQLQRKSSIGIITKSLKDTMVLYEMGYESISPASENQMIPDPILAEFFITYKYYFILFDNDAAGINGANAYVKKCLSLNPNFKLKDIYMDNAKDVSDSVRDIGFFKTKKEINEKIK